MMKKLVSSDEPIELPDPNLRGLPRELGEVLKKTLARNPAGRYAQAGEFQAELESILDSMGRRVTARDVGKYVAEVFHADLERVQGVIDQELKRVDREVAAASSRPGGTTLDLVKLEVPTSSPLSGSISGAARSVDAPALTDQRPAISVREPGLPKRSRARFIYTVAGVLALGLVVAAALRGKIAIPGMPSREQSNPPSIAPEQRTVKLSLSASPPQAELYLDDQRLGGNPHSAEFPRAERTVTIRAELSGYEPESRRVSLNNDVDLRFELSPKPALAGVDSEQEPSGAKRSARRVYTGRAQQPATPAKTEQQQVPTAPPSSAAASEPAMKAPPKRPSSGVVLDTDNPWNKK
jgi:serine/threonine-protein kinase